MHACVCVCRHVCMHDNRNMYILYACMHENKRSGNPTKTKLGSKSSTFFLSLAIRLPRLGPDCLLKTCPAPC